MSTLSPTFPNGEPDMPPDTALARLAPVVAIDVAGYSRLAEQDQKRAAQTIVQFRAAAETIVLRHHGRIFNTAGDGLMLEFPAAEHALAAIIDFVDRPLSGGLQIRLGAHLGDVHAAAGGDLLGHGVNVAARLQALARPATALLSADLCSAIQGERRQRLKAKGRVDLPKMEQRLAVYELAPLLGSEVPRIKRRSARWSLAAGFAAAATVLAVSGIAAYRFAPIFGSNSGKQQNAVPLVAVLPFDNLSAEPASQYLADGLSEEILDALSRGGAVRVAARMSSFAFRGTRKPEAGAALGADYVLDGSIRRDGPHLRISAYLNDARDGSTAWSRSYDRTLSETLALEDEIADQVAHSLNIVLVSSSTHASAAPIDPAAYELYLRGIDASQEASGPSSRQALEYFEQAVERAPNFSRAWSALARSQYDNVPSPKQSKDWERYRDEAEHSAIRALELDPKSGDAYVTLAALQEDWTKKTAFIKKGLAAAPNDSAVIDAWGRLLEVSGFEREAIPVLRRAVELDPLNPFPISALNSALAGSGDIGAANQVLNDGLMRLPMNFLLWRRKFYLALFAKDYAEVDHILAPDTARPRAFMDGADPYITNDRLFYRAYRSRSAADIGAAVQAATAIADKENSAGGALVWKLALLGKNDAAFAAAAKYFPSGAFTQTKRGAEPIFAFHLLPLYLHPVLTSFLHDSRFMRLWDQARLIDYWLASDRWPDFCADPNLGYDCKAEALKLMAARPPAAGHL